MSHFFLLHRFASKTTDELATIRTKSNNIHLISEIEKTVRETIQKVDHSYWQKQQIDQLKREKIELLMTEVQNHIREISQLMIDLTHGKLTATLMPNNTISMLISLYFKEIEPQYVIYNDTFKEFYSHFNLAAMQVKLWSAPPPENLVNPMVIKAELFQRATIEFTKVISESAVGLTSALKEE